VPQVVGGAFRHGFQENSAGLRMISAWSNLRSRWWRNFYGDQALFVRREVFCGLAGFRDLPLFEDLDLSRRMRQTGETVLLPLAVRTSGRRFLQGGVRYTLWRILQLKLRYAMGSDLQQLAHDYWSDARGGGQAQSGS
ncbi:MAG: glycosyl transferase, partial [Planctomycetota bacterium]